MIAIRVCPICKKVFEGRVGVPKVYCDECTMLEDFATGQEKLLDPLTDESRLPAAPRQTKESLLYLITPRKKY